MVSYISLSARIALRSAAHRRPPTVFASTPLNPPDAIFKLTADYKTDTFDKKVNLGVGAYRDNAGKPFVLPVVRKVSLKRSRRHVVYTAGRRLG